MRTLELLTAAVIAVACAFSAGAAEPDRREGLVSFWDFNGSLEDRAGSAADVLSAPEGQPRFAEAAHVPGAVGKAITLGVEPGDVQYLTAPASEDLQLGPSYTIEAWIHPTKLSTWNRLVLRWGTAPKYAYHLAIHNGLASHYHGQSAAEYLWAEGGRLHPGRWYHLAAVARRNHAAPAKSTLTVYLNGRPVGTAAYDGTIRSPPSEGLGVGDSAGAPAAANRFRGYVDELALWNRALEPTEIAAHFAERADVLSRLDLERRKLELAKRAQSFARLVDSGIEEIVFAERAPGRDPQGHYYANFGYSCCDPSYWLHGADGGSLSKLNLRTGELVRLVDDPGGAVRDPQVHYDAQRILFSYRKGGTHNYHLYEIRADGTGLRQITDGPWDDVEPAQLPDGDVIFCSTRCRRYIGCWLAPSATLHRCGPGGENLRRISSGSFTENTPTVLPDGRVLYTRWEYVNRDPVVFHHLWTVGPDGTGQMVYFGNMHAGGVFIDAQPIPGTDRVVMIHSPGHGRNEHAGHVAVVSNKAGPDAQSAMKTISRTADFRDPYPLSEDTFLVARGNEILLMDSRGRTEVIWTADQMVHEPRPIIRRRRERIVPSRADLASTTGTLILADVYAGRAMAGVKRGAIQKLLVLEDLSKPVNYHGGGSQPIGHGVTSTLKRILGTVPVEPDGSACFEVPPMRSLYFAALDENDRSVKQMRSFVTPQPGETLSCVGCHEPRTQTVRRRNEPVPLAARRAPSRIDPIQGVPQVMEFPRDVQPILDRHCVGCHNPDQPDGGVVLTGDRGPVFSLAYYELFLHWQVKDTHGDPLHGSGRQPGNDQPYTTYSSASPLMDKLETTHYDVQLTAAEKRTIRLWIDSGTPYPGTYAALGTGQVGGCWDSNRPVRVMADGWPSTPPAAEAVGRRCGSCHAPEQLPRHVTARIPLDPWGDMLSWTRPLSRYSRHRIFNLSRPEKSLVLMAPLSRQAGGYAKAKPEAPGAGPQQAAEDRSRPPEPVLHPVVFADSDDPDYVKILAHLEAARAKLHEIKRFDMPGFRPNEHYVREMKRYGVLPATFDPTKDPLDVYDTDEAYWRSFWRRGAEGGSPEPAESAVRE